MKRKRLLLKLTMSILIIVLAILHMQNVITNMLYLIILIVVLILFWIGMEKLKD